MDLDKIKNHLDIEETVDVSPSKKLARVKEVTVGMKVTPANTYSSVEFSQTVEILDGDQSVVTGVTNQLRQLVLNTSMELADEMVAEMHRKGML